MSDDDGDLPVAGRRSDASMAAAGGRKAGKGWDTVMDATGPVREDSAMYRALLQARASVGDLEAELRLELLRNQRSLEDTREEAPMRTQELKKLRLQLPQAEEEHRSVKKRLEAFQQDREEAKARLDSHTVSQMVDEVEQLLWEAGSDMSVRSPASGSGAPARLTNVRQQYEKGQKALAEKRRRFAQDEATCQKLQAELAASTQRMRTTELENSNRRLALEQAFEAEREACARLRRQTTLDKQEVQVLSEKERAGDTALQHAVQEQKYKVERLKAQLKRASGELLHAKENVDSRWADRFVHQIAQKDERNWQLQRKVAEAMRSKRIAEATLAQVAKGFREAEAEWRKECDSHNARAAHMLVVSSRHSQAEEGIIAWHREQAEAAEHTRLQQEALCVELRRMVRARGAAAVDASERALRLEVDALRTEVAHEAHWLQTEMSAMTQGQGQRLDNSWRRGAEDARPRSWLPGSGRPVRPGEAELRRVLAAAPPHKPGDYLTRRVSAC